MTREEAINRLKRFETDADRLGRISMDGRHKELAMAIEALENAEKYRWHNLKETPDDLPINENYIIAKIEFYGRGSERYKSDCYSVGIYRQYFKDWNLERDHLWHDEYNPHVLYKVIEWKYI